MKLGMISTVSEESFKYAMNQKLDFVEFCVNGGYNTDEIFDVEDTAVGLRLHYPLFLIYFKSNIQRKCYQNVINYIG